MEAYTLEGSPCQLMFVAAEDHQTALVTLEKAEL
jgi:hypothetical protein